MLCSQHQMLFCCLYILTHLILTTILSNQFIKKETEAQGVISPVTQLTIYRAEM